MRILDRMAVLALALLILAGAGEASRLPADGYGTLTGQFVLDGPVPDHAPLVKMGDQAAKDAAVCAKDGVPDDSLIVDPATKGIANVFVFMPKKPADIYPGLVKSKEDVIKFDQKGCRFKPHAMIVRTDQTVAVLSDDPIAHNTHVNTIANTGQNQTISPNDRSGSTRWTFPHKERYVTKVNCDIHGWMSAWWLIIDHPYATVTDKEGHFKIENIPAGEHEFTAWQEATGWVFGKERAQRNRKFTINPGQVTDIGVIKIPASAFEKK